MSDQSQSSPPAGSAAAAPAPPLLPVPGETEQERLRAMYEMLFERNPDGIAFSDSQGRVTLNPAALKLLASDKPRDEGGVATWQQTYGIFELDGKTPFPTEKMALAVSLAKGEHVVNQELMIKNSASPEGIVISASASPLPGGTGISVFRDITERKRLESDLAQRNAELALQVRENNSLIERLRLAVDELSTPVLELADDILALPVVGIVDTVRSSRMMEKILAEVVSRRCRAVIIDVTGVDVIDTSTADRLIRIARSIELLGADCVISGVQPAVAQTLTDLGVSFRGLTMQRNLKRALDVCIMRLQNSRRHSAHGAPPSRDSDPPRTRD